MVEEQAGPGEWFCAQAWAGLLAEQGRQTQALEVIAPYAATGWWTAVVEVAELLEGWGRIEEAIETVRARMALGHPDALQHYARLLARHGRAQESSTLLLPHAGDGSLARALVEVTGAAGRDEEAAELLTTRIQAHRCSDFPWCCRGFDTDTAVGLLATIRERQGKPLTRRLVSPTPQPLKPIMTTPRRCRRHLAHRDAAAQGDTPFDRRTPGAAATVLALLPATCDTRRSVRAGAWCRMIHVPDARHVRSRCIRPVPGRC